MTLFLRNHASCYNKAGRRGSTYNNGIKLIYSTKRKFFWFCTNYKYGKSFLSKINGHALMKHSNWAQSPLHVRFCTRLVFFINQTISHYCLLVVSSDVSCFSLLLFYND